MPKLMEFDDKFEKELKRINYTSALRLGLYEIEGKYMDSRRGLFAEKPLPTFITKDWQIAGGKLRAGFDVILKKIISAVAATSVKIALNRMYEVMKATYEKAISYAPFDTGTLRSSAKLYYNSKIVGTCSADGLGRFTTQFADLSGFFQSAQAYKLKRSTFAITFHRVKGEIIEDFSKSGRRPEQFDIAMFLHERLDWKPRYASWPVGPKWLERAMIQSSGDFKDILNKVIPELKRDRNIVFKRFDQRVK